MKIHIPIMTSTATIIFHMPSIAVSKTKITVAMPSWDDLLLLDWGLEGCVN
jgi:hypothetical protein